MPMMIIRDVLWYGGKGALQWHTPIYWYIPEKEKENKHYMTKCGYKFAYGLEPRPGAEKYPDCEECHR